jgi:rod shape-determining protein MreD
MTFHPLKAALILGTAILAVFLQAWWALPRWLLGAQVDLLPGLMVYASLTAGGATLALLALVGGLLLDSLSANPLGASVLPLLAVGGVVRHFRHLILRDEIYAQGVLGLGASALVPLLTIVLLLSIGQQPLVGAGSLWQWLVMSVGGAIWTPICFALFDRLLRIFSYTPLHEGSFRPDREIERGRH